MELFIRIKDGQPFEHPIFGDNFREAFPEVDTDNLPPEFARFTRHPQPQMGVYEVYQGVTYELDESGGYCDVHHVRDMTEIEKTDKQNQIREAWTQAGGFASWSLDVATCTMQPPTPHPTDGGIYKWDEPSLAWVPFTPPVPGIVTPDETAKS